MWSSSTDRKAVSGEEEDTKEQGYRYDIVGPVIYNVWCLHIKSCSSFLSEVPDMRISVDFDLVRASFAKQVQYTCLYTVASNEHN